MEVRLVTRKTRKERTLKDVIFNVCCNYIVQPDVREEPYRRLKKAQQMQTIEEGRRRRGNDKGRRGEEAKTMENVRTKAMVAAALQ
ncbi:unnamed protein product [Cuscuta campestris]|uniref:Uncharacterized protein n=1 Tax=Cuscuta campestris TaxID=132261 RepID=A0A484KF16_9ASTE|nr:unnamed protein product [Cuscuta campestris]